MLVEIKSARGIYSIPVETIHLRNRDLFLENEINAERAMDFSKQFLYLLREDKDKPIRIWINSPGGTIIDGLYLYDLITGVKDTPIYTIAAGKCYSMGGILFAAGQKGRRFMLPHSEIMLHEAYISGQIAGNGSSMKSISESLLATELKIYEILMIHTGRSIDEIKNEISYDHYFNYDEAYRFGLCDKKVSIDEILRGE